MTLIFSDDHKMFTLGRTLEVIQWFSSLGHIRNTWKAYYKTDGRLTPTVSNLAEFAFALYDTKTKIFMAKKALITGITGQDGSFLAEFLIEKGYDPKNGARPLRRCIEDEVESLLSEEIIAGKLTKGDIPVLKLSGKKLKLVKE